MTRAHVGIAVAMLALAVAAVAPRVEAGPADCASPCTVTANSAGYVAPVVPIVTGSEVVWVGSSSHPTADTATIECFRVPVGTGVTPVPVRFDLTGGPGVEATVAPGTANEETRPCEDARALPDGSVAVPFHCELHPWMVGTLRVSA